MHHDLTPPDKVTTTAVLRAHGVSNHAIATRCRPSGPWQRVLPGVVLMSALRPTRRQRLRAALAYAGPDAVISGIEALRAHDVDIPAPPDVLVLVPSARRLVSRSYLTVERTTRSPQPVIRADLPYAPLARATLDAARRAVDHEQLRTLLTSAVGPCTVAELRAELDAGSQRGSAAVRALLTPDLAGAAEVVPATVTLARRLLRGTALPSPHWHHPVHDASGMLLGIPDAWWPEVALAWDVGPQARHHDPRVWAAAGVTLLRTDPQRLNTAPAAVTDELVAAFAAAVANPQRRAC
jgi:hypothetical protein